MTKLSLLITIFGAIHARQYCRASMAACSTVSRRVRVRSSYTRYSFTGRITRRDRNRFARYMTVFQSTTYITDDQDPPSDPNALASIVVGGVEGEEGDGDGIPFMSLDIPPENVYLVDSLPSLLHVTKILDEHVLGSYPSCSSTSTSSRTDDVLGSRGGDGGEDANRGEKAVRRSPEEAQDMNDNRISLPIIAFDCEWQPEYYYKKLSVPVSETNTNTESEVVRSDTANTSESDINSKNTVAVTSEVSQSSAEPSPMTQSLSQSISKPAPVSSAVTYVRVTRRSENSSDVSNVNKANGDSDNESKNDNTENKSAVGVRVNNKKAAKRKSSPTLNTPVELLQLATRDAAFILDFQSLCRRPRAGMGYELVGTPLIETEQALDLFLRRVFHSNEIIKVGLGPTHDLKRLVWSYPWLPSLSHISAVCDVQILAKKTYPGERRQSLEGLSKLCVKQLGKRVDKSQCISPWEARPLTPAQLTYAAVDAWAIAMIFDSLQESFASSTATATARVLSRSIGEKAFVDAVASACKEYRISLPERLRDALCPFQDEEEGESDPHHDESRSNCEDENYYLDSKTAAASAISADNYTTVEFKAKPESFLPLKTLSMREIRMSKQWRPTTHTHKRENGSSNDRLF